MKHRDKFVIVSRVPLDDTRLSFRAKGLHAYLLSKPDNWTVVVKHLVTQGPDGKTAIMAALDELERHGYIVRQHRTRRGGRFDGLDCIVYEEPYKMPDGTVDENQQWHRGRFTDTVNQPLVNTDVTNTDIEKTEDLSTGSQSVPMPADFRASLGFLRSSRV